MDEIRKDPVLVKAVQAQFRRAVGMISGRWKLEILYLLSHGTRRFGELKRGLPGITQHMLTAQLRALERDGLIRRTVYAEVPPRVEYENTPAALRLRPIFVEIVKWAEEHEQRGEATTEPELQPDESA
jgi:DNA-binding HxlR family transcriptional regulator